MSASSTQFTRFPTWPHMAHRELGAGLAPAGIRDKSLKVEFIYLIEDRRRLVLTCSNHFNYGWQLVNWAERGDPPLGDSSIGGLPRTQEQSGIDQNCEASNRHFTQYYGPSIDWTCPPTFTRFSASRACQANEDANARATPNEEC
jgi:hypothetical protein